MFAVFLTGCGLFTASCSLQFDLDQEQCQTDADCTESGLPRPRCIDAVCVGDDTPPEWACLANFVSPEPGDVVEHPLRFEYITEPGVVPEGLTLRLCNSVDPMCTSPNDDVAQPDADGRVVVTTDPTFQGFLQVTSDDSKLTIVYLQPPAVLPRQENVVRMIRTPEFDGLVRLNDLELDPTRGAAVINTENCLDERAAGVSLTTVDTDEDTLGFYFSGAIPDFEATATDAQGSAGFYPLPVQSVQVEAFRADTMEFIGKTSFQILPDTLTYAFIGPTEP
ncbi:MAG: hypothetical protein AAGA56_15405 [Myxococcota bacterium]